MRTYLLIATAICGFPGMALAGVQGVQDTTSRQQNEAPVSAQERPAVPESPVPESEPPPDMRDYQAPAESSQTVTPGASPRVPATPPGAAETPSTSPATSPSNIEPSAGGAAIPPGYQRLDKIFAGRGIKLRQLVKRPFVLIGGVQAGTVNEFVVRDGIKYAHLSLPKTPDDDRSREVVVGLDKIFISPDGNTIMVAGRTRKELANLPQYLPESYQKPYQEPY